MSAWAGGLFTGLAAALLSVVVSYFAFFEHPNGFSALSTPDLFRIGFFLIIAIGILWFFVRRLLIWLTATYTITTRRLITRHGVITRKGHDIPLSRVSDVAYERDLSRAASLTKARKSSIVP